jgi:hypothetical protein
MRRLALLMALATGVLLAACGGGGDSGGSPSSPSAAPAAPAPAVPQAGDWAAGTAFGSFTFTVDAGGATISRVEYQYSSYQCGSVTHSGGIAVSTSGGWPVSNAQFEIRNDMSLMMSLIMTVRGTFSSSTAASGTWEMVSGGTTCTGTWSVG